VRSVGTIPEKTPWNYSAAQTGCTYLLHLMHDVEIVPWAVVSLAEI
jgi:hypothetical protein